MKSVSHAGCYMLSIIMHKRVFKNVKNDDENYTIGAIPRNDREREL